MERETLKYLDASILNELREMSVDQKNFLRDLCHHFTTRSEQCLESLKRAAAIRDSKLAVNAVHSLSGAAAIIGAIQFRDLCCVYEERWAESAAFPDMGMVSKLREEYNRSLRELTLLLYRDGYLSGTSVQASRQ